MASLAAAAEKASASVVRIRAVVAAHGSSTTSAEVVPTSATSTRRQRAGTGVVINAEGVILTNRHVVSDAEEVRVILSDGTVHEARVAAADDVLDLAVLRIESKPLTPLKLTTRPAASGEPVVALGTPPDANSTSIRPGLITASDVSLQNELAGRATGDYGHLIESTAEVEPGFSGGPLIDAAGRLVGINVASAGGAVPGRGRAYSIPLNGRTREVIGRLAGQVRQPRP